MKNIWLAIISVQVLFSCNPRDKVEITAPFILCKKPLGSFSLQEQETMRKKYFATSKLEHNQGGEIISKRIVIGGLKEVGIYISYYHGIVAGLGVLCNERNDTAVINDTVFIYTNPFPNVSIHTECPECKEGESDGKLYRAYLSGYTYAWHESGLLAEKCILNNDSGTYKEFYYDNGKISRAGYFKENKKNGHWKYYSESGGLLKENIFKMDTLLK
jgi:antitoxin component YwqK of YwqJK toxin-antitoxin module